MLSEHFPLRPKALGIFRVALNAVSSGLQNTQGQRQPSSQTLFRVPTVPRLAAGTWQAPVRDLRKGGGVERPTHCSASPDSDTMSTQRGAHGNLTYQREA